MSEAKNQDVDFDAIVIGAGFAGMYSLHKLRQLGFSTRVYERGDGVGGVWYWNRYPGAACDIDSWEYSYGFSEELQQEWVWTSRFATQPEILRYADHVADKFDLRRDIAFNTSFTAATWNEAGACWQVSSTSGGKSETKTCRFLIMAVGGLSTTNIPAFPGLESYQGKVYHTGQWPKEGVDFSGQRVAVIGTGSSGVQSIPLIAQEAKELTVLQRTAAYVVPARNAPLAKKELDDIKADYKTWRARSRAMSGGSGSRRILPNPKSVLEATPEEREKAFRERWENGGFGFQAAFGDIVRNLEANQFAADFVRNEIRQIVKDPETAEKLVPKHPIGCKRMCLDTGYFDTYNRPNVNLIDVTAHPIEKITSKGIQVGGKEIEFDSVVFATGYDAMTGSLTVLDITGRNGLLLRDEWKREGPRTYLGLGVSGFPNMFVIAGPGSPSVLSNMVLQIEQHVDWIGACMEYLRSNRLRSIDAIESYQDQWVDHVNAVANTTLYPTCNSWYVGANIPGKKRVFMPYLGFPTYEKKCNEVAAKGYEGFRLTA